MKIFYAFLVIVAATLLFMLPITTMVYDFRTDIREDTFTVTTAAGVTSANVTLLKTIYDNDTATISYLSSKPEVPVFTSYNTTSRQLLTGNLTALTTRTLYVSYDTDALTGYTALDTLLDRVPFIWLLIIIAFPVAALGSMFVGRNN